MEYLLKITKIHPDGTREDGYFQGLQGNSILIAEEKYRGKTFQEIVVAYAMRARYIKMRGHRPDEEITVVELQRRGHGTYD